MQLAHQEEELALCSGICRDGLVHASQRRHVRLAGRQVPSQRLRRGVVGGRAACGSRGRPADVQVAVLAGTVLQHLNHGVVGVSKVRRVEEVGKAPEEVVGVPIEAKPLLPSLRAGYVGCAEEQGPESGFDLRRHVWTTGSRSDALLGARDLHGLHELLGGGTGQRLQIRIEAFFCRWRLWCL